MKLSIENIGEFFPGFQSGDISFMRSSDCRLCVWDTPKGFALAFAQRGGQFIYIRQFKRGVAAHELGHILGLGHQPVGSGSIMTGAWNSGWSVTDSDLRRLWGAIQ